MAEPNQVFPQQRNHVHENAPPPHMHPIDQELEQRRRARAFVSFVLLYWQAYPIIQSKLTFKVDDFKTDDTTLKSILILLLDLLQILQVLWRTLRGLYDSLNEGLLQPDFDIRDVLDIFGL